VSVADGATHTQKDDVESNESLLARTAITDDYDLKTCAPEFELEISRSEEHPDQISDYQCSAL
jgi:hypothetical protein